MVTIKLDSGPLHGDVITVREMSKGDKVDIDILARFPKCTTYVAVVRGQILGICICNRYQLKYIEVDSAFQRSGIGSLLITTSRVTHTLMCETALTLQLFLKACGFVCYDSIKNGPNPGYCGLLFERPENDNSSD